MGPGVRPTFMDSDGMELQSSSTVGLLPSFFVMSLVISVRLSCCLGVREVWGIE